MYISEIERFRLEKAVRSVCSNRNKNVPAELGKVQYELYEEGVVFTKLCFLLDSVHMNYECSVAKLEMGSDGIHWNLYVAENDQDDDQVAWSLYPHSPSNHDFTILLKEIALDPYQLFW